jgi:hypothetical protein
MNQKGERSMKNLISATFAGLTAAFFLFALLAAQVGGVAPFDLKQELHHMKNQQALSSYLNQHCTIVDAQVYSYTDDKGQRQSGSVPARLYCNNYEEDENGNYVESMQQ